ncbi:unnamed protein product [Urochloa decumbens]|uniref:Pectinesterase n=1 Tax=Urochloa decumbens TaxID=240449 RepID=A0ABC8X0G6_9POAL
MPHIIAGLPLLVHVQQSLNQQGWRATAATGTPAWAEATLLQHAAVAGRADAVVAQDGSGNFTSIGAAIAAAPLRSTSRYTVHVRKGVYREIVRIPQDAWNVSLVGDGAGVTVITGNRAVDDGYLMPETATVDHFHVAWINDRRYTCVDGPGFLAQDLTIQNTAGSSKHQALALRSRSSKSVVHHCSLEGYQDTLYAQEEFQYYGDCTISGTIDFVFGNAKAVFQRCQLVARLPHQGQKNVVTAQGRSNANENTGFVFQFCNFSGDTRLREKAVETYLGRPWKTYSRIIFMESFMDDSIHPLGYLPWNNSNLGLDKLYYGEYNNSGPGSVVAGRVKWPGFHVLNGSEAANFTVSSFISGLDWLPGTGVEFTPGL